ncbi:hypothetical protein HRbin01_01549 [archaeon HR01]|nr:hypothetical protein HRbin01_01549 [archaeon HR01]
MPTISEELASFVEELKFSHIPRAVVERAKLHLLDTVGVSAAGSLEPQPRAVSEALRRITLSGESTVLWHGYKAPTPIAALANGLNAHALDYDDTHLGSIMHLSSPLVATVLSVGEAVHASGKDVMASLVAGYEVGSRIGMAARGKFHQRGFHATSVCGVLACALAAGKMMGHDRAKLAGALGIAGSMSSGLMEFLSDGSWVKPLHTGWAANAGITAALLAGYGLAGPRTILEGDRGVYAAYAGSRPSPEEVLSGLGKEWETMNISFKLFPNCHLIHKFMHAASSLKKRHNIVFSEIKEVKCFVDELAIPIICVPAERKVSPKTRYDAMFSLQYGVATVFVKNSAGIRDFDVGAGVPDEVALMARKIKFQRAGTTDGEVIEILTTDGTRYTATDSDLTEPGLEEVMVKFRGNATLVLSDEKVGELANTIMGVDMLDDVGELVKRCLSDMSEL